MAEEKLINIKTKARVFVQKVGAVEAGKKTPAKIENGVYLVESGYAEYADANSKTAGQKFIKDREAAKSEAKS